jgi:hypothetical protein
MMTMTIMKITTEMTTSEALDPLALELASASPAERQFAVSRASQPH